MKSIKWFFIALVAVVSAANAQALRVDDLPLTEVSPSADSVTGSASSILVVFLTGDGGWATLDKSIAKELAAHGAAVVGFNSRSYIEHQHDPAEFGRDVERVIQYYMPLWKRTRVVIVGYSRGAELAPFAVTRLPEDVRSHVELLAMLGLSPGASFHFHFEDLFRNVVRSSDLPTIPEIQKLKGMRILCVYGKDEDVSACRNAPPGLMSVVERPGAHHFDDNYQLLGRIILNALSSSHPTA